MIGDRPLDEHVALTRDDLSDPHAAVVAQCDMSAIYEVGLLKMDFLGLKTLTVMHDAEQYARWRVPEFKLDSVPLDDRETLDLLNRGGIRWGFSNWNPAVWWTLAAVTGFRKLKTSLTCWLFTDREPCSLWMK